MFAFLTKKGRFYRFAFMKRDNCHGDTKASSLSFDLAICRQHLSVQSVTNRVGFLPLDGSL